MVKSFIGVLMLITTCCYSQQQRGYKITGDVKNITGDWVYLQTLKLNAIERVYWPIIDSAKVKDGHFVLNKDSILLEPAWATGLFYIDSLTRKPKNLSFKNILDNDRRNTRSASIYLDNADIIITGDVKSAGGLSISGSKETDFLFQYGLMYPPSMLVLNKLIDSLEKNSDAAGLAVSIQKKNDILRNYKREFRQIIKDHPTVFMAMSNINQRSNIFSADELQDLADLVDPALLKLPTGITLKKFIAQRRLIQISKPFPDFELVDVNGKKHSLASLKGSKGTLVIFWASWCSPCREEIPELKAFEKEISNKGIALISISIDSQIGDWKKAVAEEKMPWPNLSNLPGNFKEIGEKFNVRAIPAMFLLDANNKIILADPNNFEPIKKEAMALVKK